MIARGPRRSRYDATSEANRFSARAARYARVGANVSGVAARIAGARLFGLGLDRGQNAMELAAALGGLKGPIMKVAQLMATIPDALPPEYAAELMKLQSEAPPMGWAFVKRRMAAELGPDWQKKFASFEHHPAAAASLGQVHRARSLDGAELACKLQYPDMQSAVEADLQQLQLIFAIHRRMDPAIDTTRDRQGDRRAHPRGARLPPRGQARRRSTASCSTGSTQIRVPRVWPELSTGRLLTLDWLEGAAARAQGRRSRHPQPARDARCSRPGGGRSAASASSTAIRISAITPCSRPTAAPRGHQSARLRLHPHLPAEIRRRRRRSLQRPAAATTTISSCTPTRPGASRGSIAS